MNHRQTVRIGVVSVQGDFAEHVTTFQRALRSVGANGEIVQLRTAMDANSIDGLAIPGGESTTISRLLENGGLHERITERVLADDLPVLGTCAGAILLAKEGDRQVLDTKTRLLALMDMAVDRNAFGRQRESFEVPLDVEGVGRFPAVFIRAPAITRTWGRCRPIATLEKTIVGAQDGNRLALCFHPELSGDLRIHEEFVRTCAAWKRR